MAGSDVTQATDQGHRHAMCRRQGSKPKAETAITGSVYESPVQAPRSRAPPAPDTGPSRAGVEAEPDNRERAVGTHARSGFPRAAAALHIELYPS